MSDDELSDQRTIDDGTMNDRTPGSARQPHEGAVRARLLRWVVVAGLVATPLWAQSQPAGQDGGSGIPREIAPRDTAFDDALPRAERGLIVSVEDFQGVVAGARVEVSLGEKTHSGVTSGEGRVLLDVRRAGIWEIEVSGDGYQASQGQVPWPQVASLVVELRSLDEGTPLGVEASPTGELKSWLEKGQSLLDAGRPVEAHAELSRALPHLDRKDQAEVRVTLARASWMAGERLRSIEELEEALRLDPQSETARSIYGALMDAVGRTAEVGERLAQLATEPPEGFEPRNRNPLPPPDPVAATAHAVGRQELRFTHRHPDAGLDEVTRRLGYPKDLRAAQVPIDLANESYDVFVPATYASRSESEPWGLFVWISPMERGGFRQPAIEDLLAERRLIWVGANGAGNPRPSWQRVALALHAVESAGKLWDLDPERVFLGGYSGGGRVSSMAAWQWPDVFRGAVFWMGVDHFEPIAVPYAPGKLFPASFPKPNRAQRRQVAERSRFAFVTGDRDFNRSSTRAVFRAVEELGFDGHTYLQIPGADHYLGVPADWLSRALVAIEPERGS